MGKIRSTRSIQIAKNARPHFHKEVTRKRNRNQRTAYTSLHAKAEGKAGSERQRKTIRSPVTEHRGNLKI
jgi:hypothetical protein